MGFLQDADHLLAPAVDESLAALTLADEDQAAAALARAYARQLDGAQRAEMYAERALEHTSDEDVMGRAYIQALAAKVEAKELFDRIGPKLLAVLESLGATPAGRARLRGGTTPNAAPENPLSRLRRARAAGETPA